MPAPPASSEVVSQTGVLAIDVGTPHGRVSQTGVLAIDVGTPKVRVSQVGILVIVPNQTLLHSANLFGSFCNMTGGFANA